jgi:hypothetical protein
LKAVKSIQRALIPYQMNLQSISHSVPHRHKSNFNQKIKKKLIKITGIKHKRLTVKWPVWFRVESHKWVTNKWHPNRSNKNIQYHLTSRIHCAVISTCHYSSALWFNLFFYLGVTVSKKTHYLSSMRVETFYLMKWT